jgi:hypothetical protein
MAKIFNFRVERANRHVARGIAAPETIGLTILEEMENGRLPWQIASRHGLDVTPPAGGTRAYSAFRRPTPPDAA